jgi:DNA-binding MarR family transcriptional regulator
MKAQTAARGVASPRRARADAPAALLARDLLHVTMLVMRSVAAEMRRSPHTVAPGQMGALMKLSIAASSVSDLARHMGVSVPTMSKSIDVLESRGWAERWVDPDDRRQSIVRLTPEGRRVMSAMRDRAEQHVAALLASLPAAERQAVMKALDVLKPLLGTPGQGLPGLPDRGEARPARPGSPSAVAVRDTHQKFSASTTARR